MEPQTYLLTEGRQVHEWLGAREWLFYLDILALKTNKTLFKMLFVLSKNSTKFVYS